MSKLQEVDIDVLDWNPFRLISKYPLIDKKLEALMRSIAQVGLWEGVIVRKHGNHFQLAFGHHRLEAARRSSLKTIPVIVRDLTDEQMLQFMGHENGEDYHAYFLALLETWEAAEKYLALDSVKNQKRNAIDIARFLGWTQERTMTPQEKLFAELRQRYLKIDNKKQREMALTWLVINRRIAVTMERQDWQNPRTMELLIDELVKSISAQFISSAAYISAANKNDMGDIVAQLSSMVARHIELHFASHRDQEEGPRDGHNRLH